LVIKNLDLDPEPTHSMDPDQDQESMKTDPKHCHPANTAVMSTGDFVSRWSGDGAKSNRQHKNLGLLCMSMVLKEQDKQAVLTYSFYMDRSGRNRKS
jgi:hypothetical protein